jgi:hypothetical protein
MNAPVFEIGQKVKFTDDHDLMTGEVLEVSWNSVDGYSYKVSSRYYDATQNDMVDGFITCKEEELTDMTGYDGTTDPVIPTQTINLTDSVAQDETTPEEGGAE